MTTAPVSIDALLTQARDLDTGPVRRLAQVVALAAADLNRGVGAELGTRRLARLRDEVHALEVKLAATAVPARVAAGATRAASVDYPAQLVRAWAKANGLTVPAKGPFLPDDVVAAYRAAHQDGASS